MRPNIDTFEIYYKIEEIAKKMGYKGQNGTPNYAIKKIYQIAINNFNINKKINNRYLKNIGFNWDFIKKQIEKQSPVLLNLRNDGRSFYKNHSVLIIGYLETSNKKFLAVYDNWYYWISYIDYDKLGIVCNIDFLENK